VYTWGCNDEGGLGRVTSSTDGDEFMAGLVKEMEGVNVVMVCAGDSHTMALSDNGIVYGWGTYRVRQFELYFHYRGILVAVFPILSFRERFCDWECDVEVLNVIMTLAFFLLYY